MTKTSYRFHSSNYSLFALHPREFSPDKNYSIKKPMGKYLSDRNISKKQATRLIRLKLLNITKFKNKIWVEECDTEKINEILGVM